MNYIKFTLITAFLISAFISCSNESEEYIKNQSSVKRVQFEDGKTFFRSWEELSTMDKQELKSWIDKNNTSLSDNGYKNPNLDDERDYFRALFNINNELQIGDSIIWYNKGKLLLVSANADEEEVIANKMNAEKCFIFGEIEKNNVLDNSESGTTKRSIGANALFSDHQVEFTRASGSKYKYVYELATYRTSVGSNTIYEFVFINKLEYWWKGRGWIEASETRICTTKLNGSVTCFVNGLSGNIISNSFAVNYNRTDELTYNQSMLLARVGHPNGWHTFHNWDYSIASNMTQEIKGDAAYSKRNSTFNY